MNLNWKDGWQALTGETDQEVYLSASRPIEQKIMNQQNSLQYQQPIDNRGYWYAQAPQPVPERSPTPIINQSTYPTPAPPTYCDPSTHYPTMAQPIQPQITQQVVSVPERKTELKEKRMLHITCANEQVSRHLMEVLNEYGALAFGKNSLEFGILVSDGYIYEDVRDYINQLIQGM